MEKCLRDCISGRCPASSDVDEPLHHNIEHVDTARSLCMSSLCFMQGRHWRKTFSDMSLHELDMYMSCWCTWFFLIHCICQIKWLITYNYLFSEKIRRRLIQKVIEISSRKNTFHLPLHTDVPKTVEHWQWNNDVTIAIQECLTRHYHFSDMSCYRR